MVVGPRRSDGGPRAKRFCGVGMMSPKWMFQGKTLSVASNDQSSEKAPPSRADASSDCSREGLPEKIASLIALCDLDEINPREFLKRFRARILHERFLEKGSRGRRSGAPSLESVVDEKL